MELRNDLRDILLSGLPDDERHHVVEVINLADAEKLRRKREQGAADGDVLEVVDEDVDDDSDDLTGLVPEQG